MDEAAEESERPGKWGALERAARANKGRYNTQSFRGGVTGPTALVFSPDSRFIANGGRGGVALHNLDSGSISADFSLEKSSDGMMRNEDMNSIALSPDGRHVFAGDDRGNLYCWNVSTGGLEWDHYPGLTHDAAYPYAKHINAVAVAPDGKVVASAGADGHVMVWEVATGALVADVVMAMAGHPFVPWPDTDPERVWLPPYLHVSLEHEYVPRSFSVQSMAFSPDGRWLACGMAGASEVLDAVLAIDTRTWQPRNIATYGRKKRPDPGEPTEQIDTYGKVCVLDFSPDGSLLATSGEEGVRLYAIPTDVDKPVGSEWAISEVVGYDHWSDVDGDVFRGWVGQGRFINDKLLALLTNEGFVQIVELCGDHGTWKEKAVIDVARDDKDRYDYMMLAASPNGRWLAVGKKTRFRILDLKDF